MRVLVETHDQYSERLAAEAAYSDQDSDEDEPRMVFNVPAAAAPVAAPVAVPADTGRNMEWRKHEVIQKAVGTRKIPLDHEIPGYNPNISTPSFFDQLIAERKMRMYGHKPGYAPVNEDDASRRQNILKRYRDKGYKAYDSDDLDHQVLKKAFIKSLRICQPDMYKDLDIAH